MAEQKDHVAGLAIQIPQAFIEDSIRAAVVAAIPNKEVMVDAMVKAALGEKVDNYGRQTKFEKAVGEMIQNEARKIFAEWLAANRDMIRVSLEKEITKNHKKHIAALAEKIASGVAKVGVYGVTLKFDDQE